MKIVKLLPMVKFILDIDSLTTKEFCDKYSVPHPFFTGNVDSSVDKLLQVDAVKHRMFLEYAKFLNKDLTQDMFVGERAIFVGFEAVGVRGGIPQVKNGKYIINFDQFGFYLNPYDSVDGVRLVKIEDLASAKLDISVDTKYYRYFI